MSDHGARALVLAGLILLGGGTVLWWLAGRPSGVEDITTAVAASEPGETVVIGELVEHDWAHLHVFAPYTPPDRVEAAVGQRVGAVRGLVREEVMLLVLTDGRDRVVASGLTARSPVDWLPLAAASPYEPGDARFRVVATSQGAELRPERVPGG